MHDAPRYKLAPGCHVVPSRYYIANTTSMTTVVDQPQLGFGTKLEGEAWLAGRFWHTLSAGGSPQIPEDLAVIPGKWVKRGDQPA